MRRVIAISSSFAHHSDLSGYKQILKYIKPIKVYGIDFRKSNSRFELSYYYVHEFKAWFNSLFLKFEVVHILYGEDYFRFSRMLFPRKKLVVTFHQTPEILEIELSKGNYNGKIAGLTHWLTKKRLKRLDAAIVMTQEQYNVAKDYIPSSKLHIVQFGIHLSDFNRMFMQGVKSRNRCHLLTVGNWQRDWILFFNCAKVLHKELPLIKIFVIAKNLNSDVISEIQSCPNVHYLTDITDNQLYEHYLNALALFLPLKGSAANNAINEALALGCPIVTNGHIGQFMENTSAIKKFESVTECVQVIRTLNLLPDDELKDLSLNANQSVQRFDWANVSDTIMNIYNSL